MFNFFKRKKKKVEETVEKEVVDVKENEIDENLISNESFNSDDKTNEDYNKFNQFNEANKNDEILDKIAEKVEEVKEEIESEFDEKIENIKETSEKISEDNSPKIKSGRFIDLSKSDSNSQITEKKNLKTEKILETDLKEEINKDKSEDLSAYEKENIINEEVEDKKESIFERLKKGLSKTRDNFTSSLTNLFTRNVKIDDDLYDELEEILISADIGMSSTIEIVDELRSEIKKRSIKESDKIYPVLKEIMINKLDEKNLDNEIKYEKGKLTVILVIGVNGVGKTTTIGKLANNFKKDGKNVMLAAADTFRAAAIDQLQEWSDRAGVELISHKEGADPSAVIFDAIKSARSKNIDILICDTAGRLHNKKNLMQELEKINRTIDTHAVNSNRENLLVLDATTGQNAVSQLREFKNVTNITGLILTKLDGTAKGGVIFPLQVEVEVPVKFIGVGEGIDHLQKFDSNSFVEAMF
ncbi:signal recognition particle-docking protein FtsY [uncultured Anaerococcus sp.]|uniref:signal recognition particle-docking protein FtsY n=1 Tax=uncultured Anaerococcus sp. TaxID=293428 RepID=UPI00288B2655|nr:signal recognition particle-docking protein FtsY [uncultured Anaerococcus sp.]